MDPPKDIMIGLFMVNFHVKAYIRVLSVTFLNGRLILWLTARWHNLVLRWIANPVSFGISGFKSRSRRSFMKYIHVHDIELRPETEALLDEATKVYTANHDGRTWYGRCIFISWYCSLHCTFCYRAQPGHKEKHPSESRRSMGSMLIEALFCKVFKWRIEFITGGYGIMTDEDKLEIIKNVSKVYGEKIWLNLGIMNPIQLEKVRPYVKGICSSMETLHPELHKKVCPNKPIEPYDKMFEEMTGSQKSKISGAQGEPLNFKKSIAVIVGLGEEDDIQYLFDFVEKHKLDRVTIYALKPVPGSPHKESPSVDKYVSWIAQLRIRFPKLEIIAGTNLRRCEEVGLLMRAGASAFTKFPITKQFGTKKAKLMKDLVESNGRVFTGEFMDCTGIDWEAEIAKLDIDEEYKDQMREKLPSYLSKFKNPRDRDEGTTVLK